MSSRRRKLQPVLFVFVAAAFLWAAWTDPDHRTVDLLRAATFLVVIGSYAFVRLRGARLEKDASTVTIEPGQLTPDVRAKAEGAAVATKDDAFKSIWDEEPSIWDDKR
jgi:hypothetical protein